MKRTVIYLLLPFILMGCALFQKNQDTVNDKETDVVIEDNKTTDNVTSEPHHDSSDLVFHDTELSDLINIAIEEEKIIMLFFSAEWCKPCKEYKTVTFQEEETKAYLKAHFLIKYLDVETDFEGIELNSKYNVKNLPTLVFLNPEGQEINRVVGHIAGYSFLKKIHEINAIH